LRRVGFFVRSRTYLDRAKYVRRVVFDKTGTLTTGVPRVTNPTAFDALSAADRSAVYNLAIRSTHPKSIAVGRALDDRCVSLRDGDDIEELPGLGIRGTFDGHAYFLGRDHAEQLVVTKNGEVLVTVECREDLRPGGAATVGALRREGYGVALLSGDRADRVAH